MHVSARALVRASLVASAFAPVAAFAAEPDAPFAGPPPDDAVEWLVLRTADGACLDAASGAVDAVACDGGSTQVWSFQDDHLVSADGQCLAVAPRSLGRVGARLVVAACADRRSQRFGLQGDAIVDAAGLCLDADPDGTAVRSAACDDGASQRWASLAPEAVAPGEVEGDPADDWGDDAPAVVVQGPATIVVPPAPIVMAPSQAPAPDPMGAVDQAFHFVDHALGAFRQMVDLVAPRALPRPCW